MQRTVPLTSTQLGACVLLPDSLPGTHHTCPVTQAEAVSPPIDPVSAREGI